jgi:hypothetical protein
VVGVAVLEERVHQLKYGNMTFNRSAKRGRDGSMNRPPLNPARSAINRLTIGSLIF